jgi:hypothetical protein
MVQNKQINRESIKIAYLKGSLETPMAIRCGVIRSYPQSYLKKDTLIIDQEKIKEIKMHLQRSKVDSLNPICDVRLDCYIIEADGDSLSICIGDFNCMVLNGKPMNANDTLAYLIKKYSGYYNYFSVNGLEYFKEIKLFGIPDDYKCLLRDQEPFESLRHPRFMFKDDS